VKLLYYASVAVSILRQTIVQGLVPQSEKRKHFLYHGPANTSALVLARGFTIIAYNHRLFPTLTSSFFIIYLI